MNEPNAVEFEGRSGEMRDSPWLASEDILGLGDVKVTIEKVERHNNIEFEGGRKKPVVFSITFKGKNRRLVLNGTNRKTLVEKFGNDVRSWKGKEVVLYVQPGIKVGKEMKNGIRIK
jgi:hypothetical protein